MQGVNDVFEAMFSTVLDVPIATMPILIAHRLPLPPLELFRYRPWREALLDILQNRYLMQNVTVTSCAVLQAASIHLFSFC
jgi:hypothetical protein